MVTESGVIVHATVNSSRAEWNPAHTHIRTIYTAQAHEYAKGFLGETFEFMEPGGVVGNLGTAIDGAPVFSPGEEVVLFLWTDGPSGYFQSIGFTQGALDVYELNGVKYVNRSIPVSSSQGGVGVTGRLLGSTTTGTSRQLNTLFNEISVAIAQSQAAAARKAVQQ